MGDQRGTNDLAELVRELLATRMPAAQWVSVSVLLDRLDAAVRRRDRAGAERTHRELREFIAAATRLGAGGEPEDGAPDETRERLNQLKTDWGYAADDYGLPTAGAGRDKPAGDGARLGSTIRRYIALPAVDRRGVALASSSTGDQRGWAEAFELGDMVVELRGVSASTIELRAVLTEPGDAALLVAIRIVEGDEQANYLLPFSDSHHDSLVSSLVVPVHAPLLHVEVTLPFPAELLGESDAPAARSSSARSGESGRRAWLRIAQSRPPGDPVREAVTR